MRLDSQVCHNLRDAEPQNVDPDENVTSPPKPIAATISENVKPFQNDGDLDEYNTWWVGRAHEKHALESISI